MASRSGFAIFSLILLLTISPALAQAGVLHPALSGPVNIACSPDSVDVWIFFTDRGFTGESSLDQALQNAEMQLSPKAKTRRAKALSGHLVRECDLPVNTEYVQSILALGLRYRTASRYLNALSVRTPRVKLQDIADLPFVQEVRPVAKGSRSPVPNWSTTTSGTRQPDGVDVLNYGPSYDQLNQIHVIAAHDSGYSGAGVLVGLLDTGFYKDHEALVLQPVLAEWDFINNDPETQNQPGDDPEQHDHGTCTWSALGGAHDGDLYGPAYGATFIIGKTESVTFEQPIEEDWYVAGLEWEDSLGVEVVSTSLGYLDWYTWPDMNGNTAVTTIAVDQAVTNGIVVVTAAGNERGSDWGHIIAPADADSVIAVGAVNSSGQIASFSSPGPSYDGRIKPEVCARGVSTWCATAWNGAGSYGGVGGTSLATPLVGGACALILEAHPNWRPMQVRQALLTTASVYANPNADSPNNDYGWGIINVMAAINLTYSEVIAQRHPGPGIVNTYVANLMDFWIVAVHNGGDPYMYRWLVDGAEEYYGPDSMFTYFWSVDGTSTVKVIVEDSQGRTDSTSWSVIIQPATSAPSLQSTPSPAIFTLTEPFPNPFNPTTALRYELLNAASVRLAVYDLSGRLVETLVDGWRTAGVHQVTFNASQRPAGLYFCRLQAGAEQTTVKLVLAK